MRPGKISQALQRSQEIRVCCCVCDPVHAVIARKCLGTGGKGLHGNRFSFRPRIRFKTKVEEARNAIQDGAEELDMVIISGPSNQVTTERCLKTYEMSAKQAGKSY